MATKLRFINRSCAGIVGGRPTNDMSRHVLQCKQSVRVSARVMLCGGVTTVRGQSRRRRHSAATNRATIRRGRDNAAAMAAMPKRRWKPRGGDKAFVRGRSEKRMHCSSWLCKYRASLTRKYLHHAFYSPLEGFSLGVALSDPNWNTVWRCILSNNCKSCVCRKRSMQ